MIFNTYIHKANPFMFIPVGYAPTDRYNTVSMDKQWFEDGIYPWQQRVSYEQKAQLKDRLSLQFWATPGAEVTVYLYKCDGTLVAQNLMTAIPTPNNINFNGNIYDAFQFVSNNYWVGRDEGRYYLYIEFINFEGDQTKYYITEPISLKAKHEGSVLLVYSRPDNVGGLICQQTKQKFEKRIIGAVLKLDFFVERVSFLDNGYNTTQLRAASYRGWTFIGGGNGDNLPKYEIEIVSKIWDFPAVRIDNVSYVSADGGVFKPQADDDNYPKFSASIEIRESDNDAAYTNSSGDLQLMVFTSYPFVILYSQVGVSNIYDFYYGTPVYIANLSAFQAHAAVLSTQAIIQGLEGTFRADGNGLFYTLADGEIYNQAFARQLVNLMTVTHTTTGASQDINFDTIMTGSDNGSDFCTVSPGFAIESYGTATIANSISYTSHYAPATAGTYTSYIFHDNSMRAMALSGDYLTNTGGNTPFQMNQFALVECPRLTTYSIYQSLQNSKVNLITVIIQNNITLGNLNGYFAPSFNSLGAVQVMGFGGNNMTTAQLNSLYNNIAGSSSSAVAAGIFTVHNGAIFTNGQVTGNSPTGIGPGNSGLARLTLQNTFGWAVVI